MFDVNSFSDPPHVSNFHHHHEPNIFIFGYDGTRYDLMQEQQQQLKKNEVNGQRNTSFFLFHRINGGGDN